ncbi:TrmH family RNA methyltransferase [Geofilum rhodophaeum]|jgi:TrmH family RNA methyltransferase|uniref:TrmH family RNA methyltransferase n=1 Tax=Geofilum rhodophaeum TaxID=1965019 RepID=UPI000B520CB9|nr:RNA methyltransferase [Geofilum rhodophaeum]
MLSKNQKKLIASMAQKKQRDSHGLFLAEGPKIINELLDAGFTPHLLAGTSEWKAPGRQNYETLVLSPAELSSASLLKTPQQVLALFRQPTHTLNNDAIKEDLTLVLDGIQDPGNLGTIIRMADWFGIKKLICSKDTVDAFNPKVVQATMGALARVQLFYTDLDSFLPACKKDHHLPVYGAFLEGDNIYTSSLKTPALLVMGNEGRGIRPTTSQHLTQRLTIPSFPPQSSGSESLNVGVATAIICAEFRRQQGFS